MNDYIYKLIEIKSKFISDDIKVLINNIIDLIKNYKIENEKEIEYIYNNLVNINDDTNKDKEIIKKLQEQLDLLTEDNIQLKDRINYLENDNKELRKENIQLKDEIKILNNKIVYLKNKDFINKLLICFQDLNREKLFNHPFYKYIYRIRNCINC